MSDYFGDFRLGDTLDIKFTTRQISGAPFTLAGSPVISAYVGNNTTAITAGITLSVDFNSKTGYNNVRVVATIGNGYATASNYDLCITTGTVNSVSVVGESIGSFSIENRSVYSALTGADSEPGQAAPAVNATILQKIGYLYKAWRNKSDQTSTLYRLYADDTTTVDQKRTVSDDNTTYVSGEVATGP